MLVNSRKPNAKRVAALLCLVIAMTQAASAGETIRITNGEWTPYLSEHLPHYGVSSHIVTEAFALVDVEVEYGFFPWKRSFKLAKSGEKWDGSAVWYYSEERARHFHYSDAVNQVEMAFFHLKDASFDWETMEDLKDTKIGATLEYFYGTEFKDAVDAKIIRPEWVATDELNLRKLFKGRIDVFPGAVLVTYRQIRNTLGEEDAARFEHHPKLIRSSPLHLILAKANPDNERFTELFNRGLRLLKESGRYDEIVADGIAGKYTGAD